MPQLDPILIASPVRRSGTTLLQRLLCSAENALIYGESCANDLQFMSNFFTSRQLYLGASSMVRDQQLKEVLDGKVNDWIPDLMPPTKAYLEALKTSCFSIFHYYKNYAAENGRSVWGMKMAEWSANQILHAHRLLPDSKLLYIFRPLADCIRSAKTVDLITNEQELQYFCQTWQQNLQFIKQNFPASHLYLLDYSALINDPEPVLQEIEAFTGARNIKREVLNHKINTFKSDTQRDPSGQGYLQPASISEEELKIIASFSA